LTSDSVSVVKVEPAGVPETLLPRRRGMFLDFVAPLLRLGFIDILRARL